MGRLVGGIGTSHVPSVGVAYDRKRMRAPEWAPLDDMFAPVREWLAALRPDVAIIVYNDHGGDFFFDKYPTFAVGAADSYFIADEGFGRRPLPDLRGDAAFSWHLCEQLVYDEFDITVCQEMGLEHGFLVPMNLCFPHAPAPDMPDWPVAVVPLEVNVVQHPLPTARRCWRLGEAIARAVAAYPQDTRVVVVGTGGMSHQLNGPRFGYMNEAFDRDFLDRLERDPQSLCEITHHRLMVEAGAEAVELIMWLVMRGAMGPAARRIHRGYYAPMTTGIGLITFEP